MTAAEIQRLIGQGETLAVEFKGEEHAPLNDRAVYEQVVCFATSEGGTLLIGVEDDGRVTGARPRHGATTEPARVQAAIFNNTEPRINTRVSVVSLDGRTVIAVEVDPYPEVCATRAGTALRRVMAADGPQCVPFYPHEHLSRRVHLGLLDYTAQTPAEARWEDLDPLAFERVRQTITALRGDSALPALGDPELAQALQLVETRENRLVPNMAGLLLLGRQPALERLIPTHEAAFQVLTAEADVRVNDFFRLPLIALIEEVQQRFDARVEERETLVGMLRLPVPDYSRSGFREAILNALLHRDFSQPGTVFIQWHPDHLLITSPGGFPPGVNAGNILVHEPKPRNARLYAAAKRIGLVEQTGRGVDKIFAGQLRYGRPAPDYSRSDSTGVRVVIPGGKPSLEFAAFIFEQERAGDGPSLDEMLVLSEVLQQRRASSDEAAVAIQKPAYEASRLLERLRERGWLVAAKEKRDRVYHLAPAIAERLGQPAGDRRSNGGTAARHEAAVQEYLKAHGIVTRAAVLKLCALNAREGSYLLGKMVAAGKLEKHGQGRWTHYTLKKGGTP
jgi:ATP-dependent DNA helicase RecG